MRKVALILTDKKCRGREEEVKPYKLADSGGLYPGVSSTGTGAGG